MFFYDKNDIKIINDDCINIIQNLEKESVDMVLTSPLMIILEIIKVLYGMKIFGKKLFLIYIIF